MTREGLIEMLDRIADNRNLEPFYTIKDNKILITGNNGTVDFHKTPGVNLNWIKNIPADVEFINDGPVRLDRVMEIDPSVRFNNNGWVLLKRLDIRYFNKWSGNIEGIASNRLLNLMISKGLFI
jgi:hypothetical protein